MDKIAALNQEHIPQITKIVKEATKQMDAHNI